MHSHHRKHISVQKIWLRHKLINDRFIFIHSYLLSLRINNLHISHQILLIQHYRHSNHRVIWVRQVRSRKINQNRFFLQWTFLSEPTAALLMWRWLLVRKLLHHNQRHSNLPKWCSRHLNHSTCRIISIHRMRHSTILFLYSRNRYQIRFIHLYMKSCLRLLWTCSDLRIWSVRILLHTFFRHKCFYSILRPKYFLIKAQSE